MKRILMIVSLTMLAGLAQASELWWPVADAATVDGTSGREWTTARPMANPGFGKFGTQVGGKQTGGDVSMDDKLGIGFVNTGLGGPGNSAYSFCIELYKGETGGVPDSGASSPYVGLEGGFATYDVIPEPTSGLLMALGMVLFGLKRKRI